MNYGEEVHGDIHIVEDDERCKFLILAILKRGQFKIKKKGYISIIYIYPKHGFYHADTSLFS